MKKGIKTFCKVLSVFLAVLFVIEILPLQVMAEEFTDAVAQKEFIEDLVNNPTDAEKDAESEILYEVEEKRDEHTKVYKKSDGTYTAVMTEEPLHYLDEGVWKEIDNSMILNGNIYTNLNNLFNVELPKNIDGNKELTVEKDGYELSFSIDDVKNSSAVVENNIVTSDTEIADADSAISQTQSSVTYNDIADNTDLQYIVTPNSIKENIIVSNKESVKDTYTFTFETNGLTAEKQDDGSIIFKNNNGDVKFKIPCPVMTDANFEFSYDIGVSLTENANGTVTLKYAPSTDWTSSNDRAYPITIDPAITISGDEPDFIEDTGVGYNSDAPEYADSNNSNEYLVAVTNMLTGENSDGTTTTFDSEIYTKIDTDFFKNLGNDIVFTEVQYIVAGVTTVDGKLLAREITGDWDVNTVTYNTKPELSSEVIDYYTSPLNEGEEFDNFAYVHFNITKVFNEWFNGKTNNGFALTAVGDTVAFIVINGGSQNTAMVLDYVDMGGYNENLNYHTQLVGKAGTGYVNDFTQRLSVIRDDIYVDDEFMPVTIGMIYDSSTYDKLESLNYNSLLVYGNNWIPNYLRAYLAVDENNFTYYTDTGSTIDFTRSTDDEGNVIFTELYSDIYGNHDYELEYHPASEECDAYYIINRPDGDIEKFNEYGLLISVISSQSPEQSINVVYDSNFRIDYITDINDRKYDYFYDTTGLLSEVEVSSADGTQMTTESTNLPLEICYTYDTNGNLIGVTHSGGESIEYVYDENGNMTSMTLIDSCRAKYDYDSYGRVINVTEQTYDDTVHVYVDGNAITYDRLSATKIKITENNDYEIYQFNSKGVLLHIIDSNNNNVQFGETLFGSSYNHIANGEFKNNLEYWQTKGNYETTQSIINGKSAYALEFSGGTENKNRICQIVTLEGNKNDVINISGWFKGNFTKSSTNNATLKNLIDESEDSKICNFTNDRYAQIEVCYKYTDTNDEGEEEELTEKIVVPFLENVDNWQFTAKEFTLKGDVDKLLVVIRYSKNANPALVSNIKLTNNNSKFTPNYDEYNNFVGISLGSQTILEYGYENGKLKSATYYNQASQPTTMNFLYNGTKLTQINENGTPKYKFAYNDNSTIILSSDNRIIRHVDKITGLSGFNNSFFYSIKNEDGIFVENFADKIYKTTVYDVSDDIMNRVNATTEKSKVFNVENGNGIEIESIQNWHGKRTKNIVVAKKQCGTDLETDTAKVEATYTYDENVTFETLNQVKTYTNKIYGKTQADGNLPQNYGISYKYDDNGNIVEEYEYLSEHSMLLRYSYKYDENNRLIRYNDNISSPNRSYSYEYDDNGNILSKSTYNYTSLENDLGEPLSIEYYQYNDTDELVEYNDESVTYDNNGNIASFEGTVLTWNGQQLESYERTDDNTNITTRVEYSYDENGLMTEKKVYVDKALNERYNYTWAYGQLINQIYTSYQNNEETTYAIKYVYDSFNEVQGFILNHTETYLYLKNLYGDVVGIVDEDGNIVLSYEYDVWGVPKIPYNNTEISTENIMKILPLAYRGCCYDYNTGLYYVENRYYNPSIGRFINASGAEDNGLAEPNSVDNLFTYWRNHPSWYVDYDANETYLANSIANYLYNKQLTETENVSDYYDSTNDFILNQKNEYISKYRFGYNTIGPVGCGLVAIYNALLLLGDKMEFCDVIRELETNGVLFQGFCGTHPLAIAQFFSKRGYEVNVTLNNFDETAANGDAANIMYYKHSSGEHYVAIKYKDESFEGYNTFCENTLIPDYFENSIATLEHGKETYRGLMLISISKKNNKGFN